MPPSAPATRRYAERDAVHDKREETSGGAEEARHRAEHAEDRAVAAEQMRAHAEQTAAAQRERTEAAEAARADTEQARREPTSAPNGSKPVLPTSSSSFGRQGSESDADGAPPPRSCTARPQLSPAAALDVADQLTAADDAGLSSVISGPAR